jgi:hypothetical protein
VRYLGDEKGGLVVGGDFLYVVDDEDLDGDFCGDQLEA